MNLKKMRVKECVSLLILAFFFWFLLFSPLSFLPLNFWVGMVIGTSLLAGTSLYVQRRKKELFHFSWSYVFIGICSAFILYFVFYVGNLLTGFLLPGADQNLASIYDIKEGYSPFLIGVLVFFIIGPAEEIFWRGFIQAELGNALGNIGGVLTASLLYALVHVWAGNLLLLGAAFVAGLFWGGLFIKYKSLWPVIISHSVWDVLVFLVFPFS